MLLGVAELWKALSYSLQHHPCLIIPFWDRYLRGGPGLLEKSSTSSVYSCHSGSSSESFPTCSGDANLKILEALFSFSQISTVSPFVGLSFWGSCPVVLPPKSCRYFWSGLARACKLHGLPTKGALNQTLFEGDNQSRSPGLLTHFHFFMLQIWDPHLIQFFFAPATGLNG